MTEESDAYRQRSQASIDPEGGAPHFAIECEARSLRHSVRDRYSVNRNRGRTQQQGVPGRDVFP